jgi:2-oxoisovalerate dehydrogenase E1 component
MKKESKTILIGEDIKYPYGGAFKISRDLSKLYPNQVIETPISESAITGFGIGLALMGYHPFVEIMFGDFITLCMDQIINHASKFYHQYNKQVKCPIVIRTPMGGRRGYGPTHSQSLEKFLIGIDNVKVIALNTLLDPYEIYETIFNDYEQPVIVIENKTDYNKHNSILELENYEITKSNEKYPTVKISPINHKPDITIVTYGGSVSLIKKVVDEIFYEHELISEVFVISKLSPIEVDTILDSVNATKNLITLEEGKLEGGIGSEIISTIIEKVKVRLNVKRIAAEMVPIPSPIVLESFVIPNEQKVISEISELIHE